MIARVKDWTANKVREYGNRRVERMGWPEDLLWAVLLENEDPEAAGEEKEDAQHLVEGRQRHLASRQVVVIVSLLYVDGEIHGDPEHSRNNFFDTHWNIAIIYNITSTFTHETAAD